MRFSNIYLNGKKIGNEKKNRTKFVGVGDARLGNDFGRGRDGGGN